MKTLLRGGVIVSAAGSRAADLLIDGEKIAAIGQQLSCQDAQCIDCTGLLLFPGFIDAHTHFDLDVCNTTTADDFASGSRAALLGGTTTIIDFACPNRGQSLQQGLELWHRKADGRTACDYGFHMTIDYWNESIRRELPAMLAQGVSTFKMYLTYPAMMLGDGDIYLALQALRECGALAGVHCENAGVIDAMIAQAKAAGALSPASHPRTRPALAEAEAVGRLLKLARLAEAPVMVVHLSSAEGLAEIRAARSRGQQVFAETCPQYLLLEDSRYAQRVEESVKFVCAPPLRTSADQAALWQALSDGEVQTVSTDHCSFTLAQKLAGRDDFTQIPGGLPGVETRGILLYTYGVAAGRMTKERMADVLAETPAKLYGAYPQKGVLAVGSDADIVLYDPAGAAALQAATLAGSAGYTPYEGFPIAGRVHQVWLRGTLCVSEGQLLHADGGKFLSRGLPRLK